MALKLTIDELVQVPGPLRNEYKQGEDGKFHLVLDGDHPDTAKVSQFRQNNIDLMKRNEALNAQVESDKAKLAELLARPPDASKQATELEAQLAAERAAHAATQLKHIVTSEFLRVGGRASAIDFMATEAARVFAVEDGKLATKEFSATNPSEPLSIQEFMLQQMREKDYVFQPSRGGGARQSSSGSSVKFGERSGVKTLKNPTPQELGAHSGDIAKGLVKVDYSE